MDLVSYEGEHNEANGENNQDGPDYNYSWNCGAEGPSRKKAVVSLRRGQLYNALFLVFLAQGHRVCWRGMSLAIHRKEITMSIVRTIQQAG